MLNRIRNAFPAWSLLTGILAMALLMPACGCGGSDSASSEDRRVEGSWIRPDGGYVLELTGMKKGGGLTASYFNPQPINVGRAGWRRDQGRVVVLVELSDKNYPGSTYTLEYYQAEDRLAGSYYQAVYGETYDVVFMRRQ